MKPILAIRSILLLTAGCGDDPALSGAGVNPAEPDGEVRAAVRAWLKENTNSGEWEEVRWWDAVKDAHSRRLAELKTDWWKKQPHEDAIRLKYRAASGFGGKVLSDLVFTIRKGRVVKTESYHDFQHRIHGWNTTEWFPD